jgi:hypothetical protein
MGSMRSSSWRNASFPHAEILIVSEEPTLAGLVEEFALDQLDAVILMEDSYLPHPVMLLDVELPPSRKADALSPSCESRFIYSPPKKRLTQPGRPPPPSVARL